MDAVPECNLSRFLLVYLERIDQRFYRTALQYNVMHSDGNSCGDVVLDSFNKTYRDEDKILDQIYKSKYVRICIMKILILYNIIRKCI